MEKALSGNSRCTDQCPTHEDHGKTGNQSGRQYKGTWCLIYSYLKRDLEELYKVNFPDLKVTDGLEDKQGPLYMVVQIWKINMEVWNLYKWVISESKVRWAVSTFKPFKSAGTDETIPTCTLLQHGIENLASHTLCIQSLSGIWIYFFSLGTDENDIHTKAR
jgi:hypothetical protein